MSRNKSLLALLINFTGTFEYELLVELMLRFWQHPLASDSEFSHGMMESIASVLQSSKHGEGLIDGLPPLQMNIVAAAWYVETVTLSTATDISADERTRREQWLNAIKRALPSCFASRDHLD